MLLGIIAAGSLSRLIDEKTYVLIAVAGTTGTIFIIRRNFQKIGLVMIYNGQKIPEWAMLPIAAIMGATTITAFSFLVSILSGSKMGSILPGISCAVALIENRKAEGRMMLTLSSEIRFMMTLIIQFLSIIAVIKGFDLIAKWGLLPSFAFCFPDYLFIRKIEKIEDSKKNARQDE